jgi:NADP-dependent 3-hydroxy acid dehydrogenase YdfG
LRGRVTIVTGASSGVGAAVARTLAREGASLALAARREEALLEVQKGLEGFDGEAKSVVVPTDVTDRRQVRALVARAEEECWGQSRSWSTARE